MNYWRSSANVRYEKETTIAAEQMTAVPNPPGNNTLLSSRTLRFIPAGPKISNPTTERQNTNYIPTDGSAT